MSFTILKEEEFTSFIEKCKEHSFMQTVSMSNLLRKRGFETKFLGWKSNNEITVAAIAFMKHLTGGVRIEINSGPSYTDESDLKSFYHELQLFAKKQGGHSLRQSAKNYNCITKITIRRFRGTLYWIQNSFARGRKTVCVQN